MVKAPCKESNCIQTINIIRMEGKLDQAIEKIDHISDKLENKYVTKLELQNTEQKIDTQKDRIESIELIINKLAWIVIGAVVVALIALVIK